MPDEKQKFSRLQLRKMLVEMDELTFRTVCESLCKFNTNDISEETKYELHCKNCPLWNLL